MEGGKGVAIPYIIALVIGIIVLVFVVYWVYRLFTAPQISYEDCRTRAIQWCQACRAVNPTFDVGGKNIGVTNLNSITRDCAKVLYGRFKEMNDFGGDPDDANTIGIHCNSAAASSFCSRVGG